MTQAIAASLPTRGQDSAPAIAWISQVLKERPWAQACDFATSAGVGRKTVLGLLGPNPRPSLNLSTYERIMSTGPADIRVHPRRIVSGEPAQHIVEHLIAKGWSLQQIAAEAGLSTTTLWGHNMERLHVDTIRRLARAKMTLDRRTPPIPDGHFPLTSAFPMIRRVEALIALGWSRRDIAARTGATIGALQTSRARVSAATARAVEKTFEDLRFTMGSNEAARKQAQRLGYAPWSAWPDGSIDLANAVPEWQFVSDERWRNAIRDRHTG